MAVKEKKRVQVKIDKDLADDTEAVLSELGLNPTTAINMFYKRIVANGQYQNSQRQIVPSSVAVHQPFERLPDWRGWVTMLSSQIILSWKWVPSGLE